VRCTFSASSPFAKGLTQSQIGTYWERAPLINLGPEIHDYGDTMAVLESLDGWHFQHEPR
jgi:hypothetical protein